MSNRGLTRYKTMKEEIKTMHVSYLNFVVIILMSVIVANSASRADRKFEELGKKYLDEFPSLAPVSATNLGDHRFDGKLDEVREKARIRQAEFYRKYLKQIGTIRFDELSRANQVDAIMLENRLRSSLWRLEELQEWAWNPLVYTRLTGRAIYGLVSRDFAPLEKRLVHVAERLEQFPRLFKQIQKTIDPERVPKVHAETAVKQNRGVLSILDNMVKPHIDKLRKGDQKRLEKAVETARHAVEEHQTWLKEELLPKASGDFRLGADLYDKKLAFTLHTPLTRQQIHQQADNELRRTRDEMYEIAKIVHLKEYPYTKFPDDPSDEYKQATVRASLEIAYQQLPKQDEIVETAKRSLEKVTEFVRDKDLVSIPEDPVEIIVMPEFQRGVSLAYCDSPGPLDVGQKTFYAVAPLPEEWTDEQVRSFLREYNIFSLHNLTIHEAMPGHFLQLAHSNRYPSTLRSVLSSGVFIEGWAVYTERMMIDQGFLDNDPLMRLIVLKWYLRSVANSIIDQEVHAGDMTRDEAMELMIEGTFQEEREAAGKWIRAQLTSAQLSTYFVGYLEHSELRREVEKTWGEDFSLKKYHDTVISFGSPAVQFVRALMFDLEIVP